MTTRSIHDICTVAAYQGWAGNRGLRPATGHTSAGRFLGALAGTFLGAGGIAPVRALIADQFEIGAAPLLLARMFLTAVAAPASWFPARRASRALRVF
jgi:hypothetical protein